jgi:hypothetical protein
MFGSRKNKQEKKVYPLEAIYMKDAVRRPYGTNRNEVMYKFLKDEPSLIDLKYDNDTPIINMRYPEARYMRNRLNKYLTMKKKKNEMKSYGYKNNTKRNNKNTNRNNKIKNKFNATKRNYRYNVSMRNKNNMNTNTLYSYTKKSYFR